MGAKLITDNFTDNFIIDVSKLENCNGVYLIEVLVPKESMPLSQRNSALKALIREDKSVFHIVSPVKITNAFLEFEFTKIDEADKKIAEVRYLYAD